MAQDTKRRVVVWTIFTIVPALLVYAYFSNVRTEPQAEIIQGVVVDENRPVQAPPHIPVPAPQAVTEMEATSQPAQELPMAEETTQTVDVGVPPPEREDTENIPPAPPTHPLGKFCDTATSEVQQEILNYPYESDNTEFENYQFRNADGDTIRMHISPTGAADSASPLTARFFKWDNKNNSTPIDTPAQFLGKSVAEILTSPEFTSPGYHDRKFTRTYPEGFTAIIRTANKELETFESVNQGFKIRCFRGLKCSCQVD